MYCNTPVILYLVYAVRHHHSPRGLPSIFNHRPLPSGLHYFAENCERSYDLLLESEIEAKNWFLRTLVEILVVIYGHLISFKAEINKFFGLF